MTEENTGGARIAAGSPAPRAPHWRGEQALAGPQRRPARPAVKTWQGGIARPADPEPVELASGDVLAYISRCDGCGVQALTRTRHPEWLCEDCEAFAEASAEQPDGDGWQRNTFTARIEIPPGMTPEEYLEATRMPLRAPLDYEEPRPVRHAFCSGTTKHDCTGYHCARCGHEVGREGHRICATDAPPANTIRPENEG